MHDFFPTDRSSGFPDIALEHRDIFGELDVKDSGRKSLCTVKMETREGEGGPSMMFDASTMQMLQAFNMYMKQQQTLEKKEVLATKALQAIVNKIDQFDGRNVSKYLRFYTREMELSKVSEKEMIASFELAAMPKL